MPSGRGHVGAQLLVLQELDAYLDRVEGELALAYRIEVQGDGFRGEASALARRRLASNQRLLTSLAQERRQAATALPPALLERYQRLRSQKPPPWVVAAADGRCGACKYELPLRQPFAGSAPPLDCPSCRRLLVPG